MRFDMVNDISVRRIFEPFLGDDVELYISNLPEQQAKRTL